MEAKCPFCGGKMPGMCGSWRSEGKVIQTNRCKERQAYKTELAALRALLCECGDIVEEGTHWFWGCERRKKAQALLSRIRKAREEKK